MTCGAYALLTAGGWGGGTTGAHRPPQLAFRPVKRVLLHKITTSRANSGQTSAVNANVQLQAKFSSCFSVVVTPPPSEGPRRGWSNNTSTSDSSISQCPKC